MSHHKKPVKPSVPKSHLFISAGVQLCLDTTKQKMDGQEKPCRPWRSIVTHPFTSQINILLSDFEKLSDKSKQPQNDRLIGDLSKLGTYQYISDFDIAHLMQPEFAQTYLRSGSLVALSVSRTKGDDMFAIDGHGTIHLRLTQSTYQTLGLTGRPSRFGPPRQHFFVEIHMRDPTMRSGKRNYERTHRCLKSFPGSVFGELLGPSHGLESRRWDVVMSWVDDQGNLQPIKLPASLSKASIKTCLPKLDFQQKVISKPPTLSIDCSGEEALLELYEVIGNTIIPTSDRFQTSGVVASSIEGIGFFHPTKLVELAQNLIQEHGFVSITGHTAPSSPFSFLISRQTLPPPPVDAGPKPKKKIKKGKSVMRGPERGTDAGPSSWTVVVFDAKDQAVIAPQEAVQGGADREVGQKCSKKSAELDSQCEEGIVKKKAKIDVYLPTFAVTDPRPWVVYESVGHDDTHC